MRARCERDASRCERDVSEMRARWPVGDGAELPSRFLLRRTSHKSAAGLAHLYAWGLSPDQTPGPLDLSLPLGRQVFSVFSFNSPFGGEPWSIRSDYESGDLGFDPLGLKPTSAAEYKEMATKELNNGRLAMFAIAGMVGQELATGSKLF